MKIGRFLISLLSLTLVLSMLCACNNDKTDSEETADTYYTVTFNSNGGTPIEPKKVKKNAQLDEPPTPEREGYIFEGWYNKNQQWVFSFGITEDMTLDARWLSPESLFDHTPSEDGETTVITNLKRKTEEIRLPTVMGGYHVTGIGEEVFANISGEEVYKIILPESITHIEEKAFYNCTDVEISVEGELSYIGEKAFYGCNLLTSVKLGAIEAIAPEAFTSSGLVSISLPDSVKLIDENAFDNCLSLKTVFMHDSIESIGDSAFYDTGIVTVFFFGSDETVYELIENRTENRNNAIKDAKIYIYSEASPTEETEFDGFFYFDENGKTRIWRTEE